MIKKIYSICALITAALILSSPGVYGAESIGTSGADFLELGIGSRPLAMGEAFTAEIDDINLIYYNPAGLASLKYPMLSLQHQELLLDSRYENISVAFPLYNGFLGISNSLFWVPPFDKIDIDGNKTGEVKYYNGNFTTAYGYNLDFVYVGGSVKYIYQKIDTLFLSSVAADIGVLKGLYMYSPFDSPIRNFYVGLSVQNLGTRAKDSPLPRLFRLGISYKLTKWFGLNVDLTENFINTSDLYDFTYGFDESFRVNTGVELNYLNLVYLRGGYRFNDGATYSMGIGVNYVVKDVSFIVDTSYQDSGIFGPSYSVSLSFKLIPKVITIEHKKRAEYHYKRGIKFFIANDFEGALNEFKLCRDFNPYHRNIKKKIEDIEELLELQKKNREMDEELKRFQ
jgi:long-subunit fatty acid transport protein